MVVIRVVGVIRGTEVIERWWRWCEDGSESYGREDGGGGDGVRGCCGNERRGLGGVGDFVVMIVVGYFYVKFWR